MLKSALLCKKIDENVNNQISYIDVFNSIENLTKLNFYLPLEWIGNEGKYNISVILKSPCGDEISIYNNSFVLYNYSTWREIIGYNMEFKEEGVFKFVIKCNSNVYLEVPLMIKNVSGCKRDIKTIDYLEDTK